MQRWIEVMDWQGKRVGWVRRLSSDPELWVVRGRRHEMWSSYFEAMRALLEERRNMRYCVKTALSHEYWTGESWTTNRRAACLYADHDVALRALARVERYGRGWNKVVVAEWEIENWRAA